MYDSHVKEYKRYKANQAFQNAGGYGMIGGILSAINGAIFGGINAAEQKKWNKQQQENWNRQFEYTKWLNQQQMIREDNAVQRRANDLQKAGMNRLMAAGDGAEAGTLTSFQGNAGGSPMQLDINPIEAFLAAKQSQANIANTEAQTELIRNKSQTESINKELKSAQKNLTLAMEAKTEQERKNALVDYLREWHDYEIDNRMGTKSNESPNPTNLYSALYWSYRHVMVRNGWTINDLIDHIRDKGFKEWIQDRVSDKVKPTDSAFPKADEEFWKQYPAP